ncbi:MAG: hypothetical protein IJE12_03800 [Prevotella sp.]|nr:hypothetical protein [Prevotella sp.]
MKKLYSTIMMLAMMVAALSLTACGGSDDDEIGGDGGGSSTSFTFTIIYDDGGEQVFTHDSDIAIQSLGAEFGNFERYDSPRGSYFYMMIGTKGDFYIIFPRQQYGEDLAFSYFSVGYNDFGADATDIERVSASGSGWYGEHISGSAKVTKNDGKYIIIDFNNYKYSVTSGINTSRTAYVTLKGSLAFKNSYKQ